MGESTRGSAPCQPQTDVHLLDSGANPLTTMPHCDAIDFRRVVGENNVEREVFSEGELKSQEWGKQGRQNGGRACGSSLDTSRITTTYGIVAGMLGMSLKSLIKDRFWPTGFNLGNKPESKSTINSPAVILSGWVLSRKPSLKIASYRVALNLDSGALWHHYCCSRSRSVNHRWNMHPYQT